MPAHGRDAHASEIVSTVDDVASPHVAAEAENLHADIASELVPGLWAHGGRLGRWFEDWVAAISEAHDRYASLGS